MADDVYRRYVTGLDLGQASEFTAVAALERTDRPDGPRDDGPWSSHYAVRHLERLPLGTAFPAIRDQIETMLDKVPLIGSSLAIDRTAVGQPVLDLFKNIGLGERLHSITVSAGAAAVFSEGDWQVPKKDLVGILQVLLQTRRLKIAPHLEHSATLANELRSFQVKMTPSTNDASILWRERPHDDLVLAVAVAAWVGERYLNWSGDDSPMVLGRRHTIWD